MGEVDKARDTRLDRTVAIKVLPPYASGISDLKQRFERDAQTIGSLKHPNICMLHDVGSEAPSAGSGQAAIDFIVMEYLQGETLADRLARGRGRLAKLMSSAEPIGVDYHTYAISPDGQRFLSYQFVVPGGRGRAVARARPPERAHDRHGRGDSAEEVSRASATCRAACGHASCQQIPRTLAYRVSASASAIPMLGVSPGDRIDASHRDV